MFKNATKSTKQFMLCITCVELLLPYSLFSVVSSSLSFQDHYFVVSLLIHPTLSQTFFYLYFVSVVSKVCFNLNSTLCSFFVFVDIYVNQEFHTIHKIHFKHGASLTSLCLLLFCCWEAWMVSLKTFCRWCAACFLKSLPYYICISIRQKVVFTA